MATILRAPIAGTDLIAEDLHVDDRGVHFTAATPWGRLPVDLRLAGSFNAANALAALAAACGAASPWRRRSGGSPPWSG